MKKIIISLLLIISIGNINAQVKQDTKGNFYAVKKTESESKATATGKTFTDTKGIIYPVYISARGKYFVIKTSKTGNKYNYYLKID